MGYDKKCLTHLVSEYPDFGDDFDLRRLKLCIDFRRELKSSGSSIKMIEDVLDARQPSVLDRLRAVRDDVGRALSSFARRTVPWARRRVVPFDGPS